MPPSPATPRDGAPPFDHYIACALWSSTDDGEPFDDRFTNSSAFDATALAKLRAGLEAFLTANAELIGEHTERAAHDFWLSRNGHGSGFFDRPEIYGEAQAKALQEAARKCGQLDIYIGDDGYLYAS